MFKFFLEEISFSTRERILSGNKFQMCGPDTEKPRRPYRSVLTLGTTRIPWEAERKLWRPAKEETGAELGVDIYVFWFKEFENLWINAVEPLHDLESEGHGVAPQPCTRSITLSFKVTR